jgi:type II secretory pathway component GspD/PulD (secretin)
MSCGILMFSNLSSSSRLWRAAIALCAAIVFLSNRDLAIAQQADAEPAQTPVSEVGKSESEKPEKDNPGKDDVVADFGAKANGTAAATERGSDSAKLSFNFRFAPWKLVLERFADEAGLGLDMEQVPPGTLNHYDNEKYTPAEALDVLNGYLLRRGFLLVRRDRFLVVVNIDNGIPPNLIPAVTVADLPKRGRNELLSVVFPLTDADAKTAAEDVKELLGPQGKVVPLEKINRILVTDIGSNLQRIDELLKGLGVVEDGKETSFRSFKLMHVTAVDAERMIRDLFGLPARGAAIRAAAVAVAAPAPPPTRSDRREWGGRGWGRGERGGGDWGGGRGDWGRRDGGNEGGDDRQPAAPAPAAAPVASTPKIQMTVDTRTNSLLVTAGRDDLELVEQAIRTIDVAEARSARSPFSRRSNIPQLEVYPVENADVQVVVEMINSTVPGLIIREDAKTRRINVYATPDDQEQVRNIVKQLDGGAGESTTVVPLHRNEAAPVAASLRSLFGNNKSDSPSIEADAVGRRLLIRGTPEQVGQIRKMLADMGESGEISPAAGSAGGPIRTISPGGRSAEELLELIQRLMPSAEGRSIRVVPPSAIATPTFRLREIDAPKDQFDRKQRGVQEQESADSPDKTGAKRRDRAGGRSSAVPIVESLIRPAASGSAAIEESQAVEADDAEVDRLCHELEAAYADAAADESSDELDHVATDPDNSDALEKTLPKKPADDARRTSPRADSDADEEVRITAYHGKILIASENQQALDRLEQLLEALAESGSKKTTWTVYHLRSADAAETATILGSLFPAGSVPSASSSSGFLRSFRSGFSSRGRSLMDADGLDSLSTNNSLRIIPESRMNALFISGPHEQVNQVLEALEVLDASELPQSLRDRSPRMITVQHADVDEVASIVRDVYEQEMGTSQSGTSPSDTGRSGRRGFNPFAMLMGGRGGQNDRSPNVKLSIGVDSRTNTLIVSSSDQLFREIESLVESLDQSAQEAKRTVRVHTVTQGSVELVETALKPLLGKVSISSTGSNRSRSERSSAAPEEAASGKGTERSSDDSARALFEQRMMERMVDGGRGRRRSDRDGDSRGGRGRDRGESRSRRN